jgi:hypothetical protein
LPCDDETLLAPEWEFELDLPLSPEPLEWPALVSLPESSVWATADTA